MKFLFAHNNINVRDLDAAIAFYERALGLKVENKRGPEDGSFVLAFLTDGERAHRLELTWLRNHEGAYELGENESHLCFTVDDYESAHALHAEMGCICYENPGMGLYFISDPDGYWIEIVPDKR